MPCLFRDKLIWCRYSCRHRLWLTRPESNFSLWTSRLARLRLKAAAMRAHINRIWQEEHNNSCSCMSVRKDVKHLAHHDPSETAHRTAPREVLPSSVICIKELAL